MGEEYASGWRLSCFLTWHLQRWAGCRVLFLLQLFIQAPPETSVFPSASCPRMHDDILSGDHLVLITKPLKVHRLPHSPPSPKTWKGQLWSCTSWGCRMLSIAASLPQPGLLWGHDGKVTSVRISGDKLVLVLSTSRSPTHYPFSALELHWGLWVEWEGAWDPPATSLWKSDTVALQSDCIHTPFSGKALFLLGQEKKSWLRKYSDYIV